MLINITLFVHGDDHTGIPWTWLINMCGICGELRFEPGPSLADWPALIDLMRRRGPDGVGHWTDDQYCDLGFRRLAILDLSSMGNQPMATSDGHYLIVYNGELYNFRELRTQLDNKGFRFHSTGDTEVVLKALVAWGEAALTRFNGMFALAFFDVLEKRLLLARDHAGIKPLYYMYTEQGVMFASQYDQILAHPWSHTLSVSQKAMVSYFKHLYIPAPDALLENTHMLEPGTWVEFNTSGKVRQGRHFEFSQQLSPTLRGQEAYEAVDTAVSNAVRRQLISDVPVGTFLSGGIDSPLVTAKVREIAHNCCPAFTIGTNGHVSDESPQAAEYAAQLGIEHILEHITPDHTINLLDSVVTASSEPFADYSMFPTMLVSRLAKQSVTVALSGDGGDESFWGYNRFFTPLEQSEEFRQPYWLRRMRLLYRKIFRLGGFRASLRLPEIGEWYQIRHSFFTNSELSNIFPSLLPEEEHQHRLSFKGWRQDDTAQWLRWYEFTQYLPEVLLKVDRASMFYGLEVRVPLLDKEVLGIAARLDWTSCLDLERGIGKLPLRWSLAAHLSNQSTTKRGFTVPMDKWLCGPLRQVFSDNVLYRTTLLGFPINTDAVRSLYELHLSGHKDHTMQLWLLLSLALWERHFLANRSSGPE